MGGKVVKDGYKVGDKIVYPVHGVGVVNSIEVIKVGQSEQRFYRITILETGAVIRVAIPQADTVGLRRVADNKTIEKVYDILRDKDVIVNTQTWNRRQREYNQKIKTGSVFEIAKVIRDLSVLRSDKELSFGEKRMLDRAQDLLIKEISVAKSRPEDAVKAELQEICAAVH